MKRFLYLLLALPLLGFIATSCSDDDDLPDVTLSMDYSGATLTDGVFTVEQGDTLKINALKVIPAEGTKPATLGPVSYFIDGFYQFTSYEVPFSCYIPTENLKVGKYLLQAKATILQIDKTMAFGVFSYPINVVEKENPDDGNSGESGTDIPDVRVTDHE
ncbi:MAG: hypothetical protein J6A20_05075 [Muribaculaceae bacterium]|nr:hypothetical protein [Muribaculaceae bacterium]